MANDNKGIAALAANDPINWLLGSVLRNAAARGERPYLLNALAGNNLHVVRAWNAWIGEFRSLLLKPELAPKKAEEELSGNRVERLDDFMAEVFSVLHLSKRGYSDFEIVLAKGDKKTVDFVARRAGKRVRIDVKHLHEPEDIIRTVAVQRWRKCSAEHPDKFNIAILLMHSHEGPLSDAAISKLRNVIDQVPDAARDEYEVKLDENVTIRIRRTNTADLGDKRPGLGVGTGIGVEDLEFDLPELQRLFVKAFRTTGEAVEKFFGRQFDAEVENLIVMRWQAPKLMYNPSAPQTDRTQLRVPFLLSDCI